MIRFLVALVASLSLTVAARAAELPTGTWAVNSGGTKGNLIITEVGKDGKVKAKFLGAEVTGIWKKDVLTLNEVAGLVEARLVSEPAGKGKIKYTLTGTRTQVTFFPVAPDSGEHKSGWYAQITADVPPPAPTGEIKTEVRGVLVQDGTSVYVSVKQKDIFGKVQETRIYVWKSEGEWKALQNTLKPMYGKEIVVTATLAQLPKGHMTSIPEEALYFLGKFEPKLANALKE
jgi:hypothetical protein